MNEQNQNIIKLLAEGLTVKEVADKMNMKVRTVEQRVRKMKEKYSCKTVTQLVVIALSETYSK